MEPKRSGYSRAQIIIHWTTVLLIVLQLVTAIWMDPAFEARLGEADADDEPGNPVLHILFGVAVLLLTAWRLAIRLRRGAPAGAPGENTLLSTLAKANHIGLYALLFLMPLTGAIAWFGGQEWAGDLHSTLRWVLIALVALHIGGALFEQFVLRNGVLARITRPEH